ncbi:DUF4440 domain-containing protein [Pseudonocardia adelaidensis]|uniref:DUF4440 domain-containing protein n=1 Tax=Pseudonocardia adelaidensis TaxID=648754 RepID=A0ABP9NKF9_9PSEU
MTDELHERCAAQIEGLHRVIEEWLAGRSPRTAEAFAAFADAHSPDFTMVTPDGALLRRDELLPGFEGAHGAAPGLRIRIADVAVVHSDVGGVLATYEEWQDGPAGRTGRRSTVLLERHTGARHGLRSRHLHATWIDRER